MHVLCPSCAAEYEIPELQRPRKLRCARCAAEWRVMPEPAPAAEAVAEAPNMPAIAEPAPEAFAVMPPPSRPLQAAAPIARAPARHGIDRIGIVWMVLWALSLLLIVAGLFALWHWRGPIEQAWPPSLRLYRLFPGGLKTGHAVPSP